MPIELPIHGRGAGNNPPNRFQPLHVEADGDYLDGLSDEDRIGPTTQFFRDSTRTIIAHNDSPDVGFTWSINPYRGCEHGCIYCYARPTHEYLSLSAGLDFETKIFVKEHAPELLREELMRKSWPGHTLSISGVTDCYQPIERKLQITRKCIEVLLEFRNPLGIVTKNYGVTRDIDLLSQLAALNAAAVFVSVTTLDEDLARVMEPRTSTPKRRLAAIKALTDAGIPVGVMVAPVIPGLTDHELPSIIEAASEAGARQAGYVPVRLPFAVAPLFEQWLQTHRPDRKDKVLNRIRSLRDGKLNDSNFHTRMRGAGPFADQIKLMFDLACRRHHMNETKLSLTTDHFRKPSKQMTLFG